MHLDEETCQSERKVLRIRSGTRTITEQGKTHLEIALSGWPAARPPASMSGAAAPCCCSARRLGSVQTMTLPCLHTCTAVCNGVLYSSVLFSSTECRNLYTLTDMERLLQLPDPTWAGESGYMFLCNPNTAMLGATAP